MANEKRALNSRFCWFWNNHLVRIEDLKFAPTSFAELFTLRSLHSEYGAVYSEFSWCFHKDTPVIGLAGINQLTHFYWLGVHVSFVNVHEGRAEGPWDLASVLNGPRLLKKLARRNFRLGLVGVALPDNRALVRYRTDCEAAYARQGFGEWIGVTLKLKFLLDLTFFCLQLCNFFILLLQLNLLGLIEFLKRDNLLLESFYSLVRVFLARV